MSFHFFFIQQTAISFSKFCVTEKGLDLLFCVGLGRCQDGSTTMLLGMSCLKKMESWDFKNKFNVSFSLTVSQRRGDEGESGPSFVCQRYPKFEGCTTRPFVTCCIA